MDLLDLHYIRHALSNDKDFFIEQDTILSTYEGHTIFSVFLEKLKVFEEILSKFKGSKYEDEQNKMKKMAENSVIRRLYRILSMPTDEIPGRNHTISDFNCLVCIKSEKDK